MAVTAPTSRVLDFIRLGTTKALVGWTDGSARLRMEVNPNIVNKSVVVTDRYCAPTGNH